MKIWCQQILFITTEQNIVEVVLKYYSLATGDEQRMKILTVQFFFQYHFSENKIGRPAENSKKCISIAKI